MKSCVLPCLMVAIGITLCATESGAQVSEQPYTPDARVKRYHAYEFETSVEYAQKVGINKGAPFIVVGLLALLFFTCWSCTRCCCRKCSKRPETDRTKIVVTILAVVVCIVCASLLIVSLKWEKDQSTAFQNVPELIQNVIDWKEESVEKANNITAVLTRILGRTADIKALDSGDSYGIHSTLDTIDSQVGFVTVAVNSIIANVADVGLEDFKEKFSDDVSDVDDQRHLFVSYTLIALICFICFQVIIALMDLYAPPACKPHKVAYCFTPCITAVFLILMFVVWIVCGVMFATTTFFADFCVNADANILSTSGLQDDSIVSYYVLCDQDDSTLIFPFQSQVQEISDAFNTINSNADTVVSTLPGNCESTSPCDDVYDVVQAMLNDVNDLHLAVGKDTNADGEINTGLLAQLACTALNGKYQAVLNVLCGDFFDALAKFLELFIAFACMMIIAEVVRRYMPRSTDKEDDIDNPNKDEPGSAKDFRRSSRQLEESEVF